VSAFPRITIDLKKMGGLPCIRGLGIPVTAIVEMVEQGTSSAEILKKYPALEPDDISEALRFAAEVVRRLGLAKS
jgi:uncharacterized protein (DUF433 family)